MPAAQAFRSSAMPLPWSHILGLFWNAACLFPPTPQPSPVAETEQLLFVLLRGTHNLIPPHQSLPDRRVPAQLIIFHTQVTSHLWSSLLLQAGFSSIMQKAFELEKPELYTLLRMRAVA